MQVCQSQKPKDRRRGISLLPLRTRSTLSRPFSSLALMRIGNWKVETGKPGVHIGMGMGTGTRITTTSSLALWLSGSNRMWAWTPLPSISVLERYLHLLATSIWPKPLHPPPFPAIPLHFHCHISNILHFVPRLISLSPSIYLSINPVPSRHCCRLLGHCLLIVVIYRSSATLPLAVWLIVTGCAAACAGWIQPTPNEIVPSRSSAFP